jgi:hypothetical protein
MTQHKDDSIVYLTVSIKISKMDILDHFRFLTDFESFVTL